MKPRLFISHSSKDPVLTDEVSKTLGDTVGAHPGFDVLVDRDSLQAGTPWSSQLDAMMADAHAGLLLITPQALARPDWIRKEAYILGWRQSLDAAFPLFVALLDGTTSADLDAAGLGPAHLSAIQRLKGADVAALAAEVRAAAPPIQPATPFEELTASLADHLDLDQAKLDALVGKFALPAVPWHPGGPALGVARVAARILSGDLGTGNNISDLINMLRRWKIPKESLKVILRFVAPFWVPAQAAGPMARAVRDLRTARQNGWATINGKYVLQYTAKIFVDKVEPLNFAARVATNIETPVTNPGADAYTAAICQWLRREDQKHPEDEQVGYSDDDAILVADLARQKVFLFVLLQPPPDPATLKALRDTFPTVVFLFCTDASRAASESSIPTLDVDHAIEQRQYDHWRDAINTLRTSP